VIFEIDNNCGRGVCFSNMGSVCTPSAWATLNTSISTPKELKQHLQFATIMGEVIPTSTSKTDSTINPKLFHNVFLLQSVHETKEVAIAGGVAGTGADKLLATLATHLLNQARCLMTKTSITSKPRASE